jgi:nucleoside-diphosphate-sugar epimerase
MAARPVAITGATGHVGRRLTRHLVRSGRRVRVLARNPAAAAAVLPASCEIIEGDLREAAGPTRLVEPGCDVVNLAHLWDGSLEDNVRAVRGLLSACAAGDSRRLVHLSSVAVFGRAPGDRVDEASPCLPVIAYGRAKLALEKLLAAEARTPFTIVRPATVFGEPGPPLDALIAELRRPVRIKGWLLSSVSGARRMNLVHVDNVVAAISFLLEAESFPGGQAFIVSDDDHPANNFSGVERELMKSLGVPDYALPRLPVPAWALALLLRARGHNNVNPRRTFDGARLAALGYRPPVDFIQGLAALAR